MVVQMADLERTLRHVVEKTAKGTKRGYVSYDDLSTRKLAKQDPELFLQQNPPPVIIDEIQYAPELFPYIKIYADSHRDHKGAFWKKTEPCIRLK